MSATGAEERSRRRKGRRLTVEEPRMALACYPGAMPEG